VAGLDERTCVFLLQFQIPLPREKKKKKKCRCGLRATPTQKRNVVKKTKQCRQGEEQNDL